jgi:phosphomethylpyrimidine synthase
LCYVTPREHLGLPNADDVRAGVVASRIAAHAGDVARGHAGAAEQDRQLSIARANLDWDSHIAGTLDPQLAQQMHDEACRAAETKTADYCSMCGKNWCSVRINREIRDVIKSADAVES